MEQGKSWSAPGPTPGSALGYTGPQGYGASDYQRKFIDDYLKLRRYDLTDANREIVAQSIEQYGGGGLVLPNQLIVFLDNLYRLNSI